MAGLLKRIFSFGKKQVEETPAPDPETVEVSPQAAPTPEAKTHEPAAPEPEVEPAPSPDIEPEPAPVEEEQTALETETEQVDERRQETVSVPQPEPQRTPEPEAPSTPEPEPEPQPAPEAAPAVPAPAPTPQSGTPRSVVIGDAPAPAATSEPEPQQRGWLQRLTGGLSRSSRQLSDNIAGVFTRRKLDEETLEELEDILIQADLGVETAMRITDALSSGRYGKDVSPSEVRDVMASEIEKVLEPVAQPLELDLSVKPHVILVVGVNGTGKTTTIGKLSAKLRDAGLKVTLGAGDTFRAAAIEQLKIWADRTGSTFVGTKLGADAAGLAYEAYEQARDNGSDVVIIDTAGRLQNKTELMDELAKIVRVLQKHDPDAPHTVLQTLDATTGQNALNQVEIFRNIAGVNGIVMTKLDGTARGGILVAISAKFGLPVYFIGVGEGVDDLEPFRAIDFAQAIAGAGTGEEKDQ